jgi:pyruvate dehydrogenase E2 component (dihydrolipoamide acetyltransferase)
MRTFALPDLGEGLKDAEIVAWHVAPGDHVVADQPLVSVETAKAVVDIPAPWSGRVVRTFGAPHDIVAIGAALAEIDTEGVTDKGAVIGDLLQAPASDHAPAPARDQHAPAGRSQTARASPAVRQKARALGVDLSLIAGSGPNGTITLADVESRAAKSIAQPGYEPLRGVRRAMAEAMAKVRAEVVPSSLTDEAIVERWPVDADPTTRLIRAVVAGCRASPSLNAWFDSSSCARKLHQRIDLGIALEAADGLFVPVIRDVASRNDADLRAALETAKLEVAHRTIAGSNLQGQTITLSNFGMLGGMHAVLAVMPPQVAILGAGRIHKAVRVVGEETRAVQVLPLSLTFDHRAVTGAEACKFMASAIADLSS